MRQKPINHLTRLLVFFTFIFSSGYLLAANQIGIILNNYSLSEGEGLEVFVSADADEISPSHADVYLIVVLPNGHYFSFGEDESLSETDSLIPFVRGWSIHSVPAHNLLNLTIPDGIPPGNYQWILMLVQTGQDPQTAENIIARESKQLTVRGASSETGSSSGSFSGGCGVCSGGASPDSVSSSSSSSSSTSTGGSSTGSSSSTSSGGSLTSSSSSGGSGDFASSGGIASTSSSSGSSSGGSIEIDPVQIIPGTLTAGDIDDNLNYASFLNYLNRQLQANIEVFANASVTNVPANGVSVSNLPSVLADRISILVNDNEGNGIPNARVIVKELSTEEEVFRTYTTYDGHVYLYPAFDNIDLPTTDIENNGQATTAVEISANLDITAITLPETNVILPEDIATYHYSTEFTAYDSSGLPITVFLYFARTDTLVTTQGGSSWDLGVRISDNNGLNTDFFADPGVYSLLFDANGSLEQLLSQPAISIELENNSLELSAIISTGATSPQIMSIDFSDITQVGSTFVVNEISQNGIANSPSEDDIISQDPQFRLEITTENDALTYTTDVNLSSSTETELQVTADTLSSSLPQQLDLMFVIDTTGSMYDELNYLTTEFRNIVTTISSNFPSIDLRFGLIVYRDTTDSYVVRDFPFTASVDTMEAQLQDQFAGGGGDYPEAMDQAFEAALSASWRQGNTARLMFLVADAPPHDENLNTMLSLAQTPRQEGIRVYSLAASGVGDTAEYIMRAVSAVTQARYLFLTDDSGVGNAHAEPDTPCYVVSRLNDLISRIVNSELSGERVEAQENDIVREIGSQQSGVCQSGNNSENLDDIPFIIQL